MAKIESILDHISHPHAEIVFRTLLEMTKDIGADLVKINGLASAKLSRQFFVAENGSEQYAEQLLFNLSANNASRNSIPVMKIMFYSTPIKRDHLELLKLAAAPVEKYVQSTLFKTFEQLASESPYIDSEGLQSQTSAAAIKGFEEHLLKLQDVCVVIPEQVTYTRKVGMNNLVLPFRLHLIDELMDEEDPIMSFQVSVDLYSPAYVAISLEEQKRKDEA